MASRKTERKTENKPKASNLKKIGALWIGNGKNGKFMSGRIELSEDEELRVLVFKNGYKEKPSQPDYVIYEPKDDDNRSAGFPGDDKDNDPLND
jgi:hypothetical protein